MARCRAERHEIAARFAEFEIIGAPEIRDSIRRRVRSNNCAQSVASVDWSANSAVLIAHLARRPILWTNAFFRRDRNKEPPVRGPSRLCDTLSGRLRRQPRQPIRSIPEPIEVIRGAASDAVARRNCRCNIRQRVRSVGIRNNLHHRRPYARTCLGSQLIRRDQSLRRDRGR